MAKKERFQINLRGIIDLLSNHLYSGPEVFLRELLQNGTDALTARRALDPGHAGSLHVELVKPAQPGAPATLVFEDNGIGLTQKEIETFLSTIGLSSKRDDLDRQRSEFLGQFGIGLLSCFMVSDEIVMVTKSARGDEPVLQWTGRPDGTYSLEPLTSNLEPGTRVYLRARTDTAVGELFTATRIEDLLKKYGSLLPWPIFLKKEIGQERLNPHPPPWRAQYATAGARRQAYLQFGKDLHCQNFLDAFPIQSKAGGVEGIAWVLPYTPDLASRGRHRVYLKGMLLSEAAENLLPDWAFFIHSVVDASNLRPTASREGFYEDTVLAETRDELSNAVRDYLCTLAKEDPSRLKQLIQLHFLSIKALATQDEEFCRLFIGWLPFETNQGTLTLTEIAGRYGKISYTTNRDQFRQVAQVATAQGLCVVDGGYTYDGELLSAYAVIQPEIPVEPLEASRLLDQFENLTLDEQDRCFDFTQLAEETLRPFRCHSELRRFQPADLTGLYSLSRDAALWRSVQQSKQVSNALWSSVLDGVIRPGQQNADFSDLCFNLNNPLVSRLTETQDKAVVRRCIQMLYLQALLQGHQPLRTDEMKLLNTGMLELINWSLDGRKSKPA